MGAPAEMPHADEALKSLVSRFRDEPGSAAFTELAAALLARGHASEALRIAEHGLQLVPDSVDGRVERAAALLALGRPRVAFVELKRALAIHPNNRRAMRLLGKVYVDAGSPSRAAELLKQRFSSGADEEQETTHVTQAPVPAPPPAHDNGHSEAQGASQPPIPRGDTAPLPKRGSPPIPPVQPASAANASQLAHREDTVKPGHAAQGPNQGQAQTHGTAQNQAHPSAAAYSATTPAAPGTSTAASSSKTGQALPELFSDLTRDLGLGDAVPETPVSRVEVTQIIRRRKERQPRSPSELAMIEGPIVDTTQPGQITENTEGTGELSQNLLSSEPPPLFDAVTSPRLQLAPFGLDDEPLFQEHMPFAVRPVEQGSTEAQPADTHGDLLGDLDPLGDLRETLDEEAPPEVDTAVRAALAGAGEKRDIRETLSPTGRPPADPPKPGESFKFTEGGDTLVEGLEEASSLEATPAAALPRALSPKEEETPEDGARFDGAARPLLELSRPTRRLVGAPKLELVEPKAKPRDVMLAAIGAVVMLLAIVVFLASAPRAWRLSVFADDADETQATRTSGHEERASERSSEANPIAKDAPRDRAH